MQPDKSQKESALGYDTASKVLFLANVGRKDPWWRAPFNPRVPKIEIPIKDLISYRNIFSRGYDYYEFRTTKGLFVAHVPQGAYHDVLEELSKEGKRGEVNVLKEYVAPALLILSGVGAFFWILTLVKG